MGFAVNDPDSLQIWIPTTFSQIMSVAYPVSVNRPLIADVTALRHVTQTPQKIEFEV
jgi:hypothetical protein